jgi:hypothetical protein
MENDMEELEGLDRKSLEEQYIRSYQYTRPQKIMGLIAVIVVLGGIITAGTILFVNIIDLFIK